jgi:hypothetical protein
MYGEEFDRDDMSPDDCVRLLNLMNSLIVDEMSRSVEEKDEISLDKYAVMDMMIEEAGMPFDDIIRFCEIGEYIMLDRETRSMTDEEAAAWKYKREAVIAMIDTILMNAAKAGMIDPDDVASDPTVEMLEEIWKLS